MSGEPKSLSCALVFMVWTAACAVDAGANPAERCGVEGQCAHGMVCYRGYCVLENDGGHSDEQKDAGVSEAGPSEPTPPPASPPKPVPPSQPAPSPTPAPQPAPQPETAPKPEAKPEPEPSAPTWSNPSSDPLCGFLCEVLGECACVDGGVPAWPCEDEETRCGGRCVDLRTDRDHCGRCGRECERGRCEEGRCARADDGDDED